MNRKLASESKDKKLDVAQYETAPPINVTKTNTNIEKDFLNSLTDVIEETLQLGEFFVEEKRLITELGRIVRKILPRFEATVPIPNNIFRKGNMVVKDAVLNSQGHLIVNYPNGTTKCLTFEDCSPEILKDILKEAFPKLEESAKALKAKVRSRVNLFDKVVGELEKVGEALEIDRKGIIDEDVVKKSLKS